MAAHKIIVVPGVFVDEKTAGVNEFPLLASLIDGQTTNLFCGATVIGRHHALTAARCLTDVNPSQIALLVGDHDMADLGSDPSILIVITEIYIHPSYDPSSVAYDLAVVETYEEIPFSAKVGPACLPFKYVNNDFVGDTVKVLGWGSVNFEGPVSGPLQRSYLRVAPASRCAGAREQLCTHNSGKANNSCQVDTGGPILWSDPATGKLNVVGVVSDGRSVCADSTPSVQTRLATAVNMNWINIILTGQYYCN